MQVLPTYIYPKGNPYIILNLSINNICGYVKKNNHKIFGNTRVINKLTPLMHNKHIEITFKAPYNGETEDSIPR
jgi:hypothetical protein